jgi:hypothetical protein
MTTANETKQSRSTIGLDSPIKNNAKADSIAIANPNQNTPFTEGLPNLI